MADKGYVFTVHKSTMKILIIKQKVKNNYKT